MVETLLNGRWRLSLPSHRAKRPEWVTGWERERLNSMALNVAPGDVVIDVGAEEGDMSALYASWGARVVLIEPNPLVWPNIKAIWDANELPRPLGCWVGFAGSEHRERPYPATGDDGWPACADGPVIGDHGFLNLWERDDVAVMPLDAWLPTVNAVGSDVHLTIDVEGAELEVLRGADLLLRTVRPLVWCSVHPLFMRENYEHPRALYRFMSDRDYTGHILASDHEVHTLWVPW